MQVNSFCERQFFKHIDISAQELSQLGKPEKVCLFKNNKKAQKLETETIFVCVTKTGESTRNILNCCFLQQVLTLSHQTKYIPIEY